MHGVWDNWLPVISCVILGKFSISVSWSVIQGYHYLGCSAVLRVKWEAVLKACGTLEALNKCWLSPSALFCRGLKDAKRETFKTIHICEFMHKNTQLENLSISFCADYNQYLIFSLYKGKLLQPGIYSKIHLVLSGIWFCSELQ